MSQASHISSLLAVLLLAASLLIAGCSKKELPTDEFQVLQQTPEARAQALADAKTKCEEQTRKSGMKSMLSIFSRLRPGSAERAFVDCMEDKGFDPNSAEAFPERPEDGTLMSDVPPEN
ncbi:hypothetical protein A7A08_02155 [Methyloligella halotolerans]|uniref:Uncharacterized protein n=1 Tax=Methyloligella halotolerans TaxID=1177755 RepID=A0A1E2RXN0_9HYPH|nr:hypothetical protein [Methyloligella halotolerans]ODA66858.1 hypothetical protein A7A08_02155 [Methyloligella halotolerans]